MLSSRAPKSWPKLPEGPYTALRAGAGASLFRGNELGGQDNKLHGISYEKRYRAHTSANNCELLQRWMLPRHSSNMSITHLGLLCSQLRLNLDTHLAPCARSRNHQAALLHGKGESGSLAVPMLAAALRSRESALGRSDRKSVV